MINLHIMKLILLVICVIYICQSVGNTTKDLDRTTMNATTTNQNNDTMISSNKTTNTITSTSKKPTPFCSKQQLSLLGNQTGDSICVKELARVKTEKELHEIPNIQGLPVTKVLFYSPACKNPKCMGLFNSLKKLKLHCNVIVILPKYRMNDTKNSSEASDNYHNHTENIAKILDHATGVCNTSNTTKDHDDDHQSGKNEGRRNTGGLTNENLIIFTILVNVFGFYLWDL